MFKEWLFSKKTIFVLVLIIAMYGVHLYRSHTSLPKKDIHFSYTGNTMGTRFLLAYKDTLSRRLNKEVDSILKVANQAFSTYKPTSEISELNQKDSLLEATKHFRNVFELAKEVYQLSDGAFDPTVMPLVNYWGFGPANKRSSIDSMEIDSLKQIVGFDKVSKEGKRIYKKDHRIQLDFSAIAKGYAVDMVADYFLSIGINDFMIEIGGEIRVHGNYAQNKPWKTSIEDPDEDAIERVFSQVILSNEALATSGNYRNIRIVDGKKVAHTIDPVSGYPKVSNILSASIIAPTCGKADAFATACMVLGFERSKQMIEKTKEVEAMFIYLNKKGESTVWATKKMSEKLVNK